jgi:hypothetical protein
MKPSERILEARDAFFKVTLETARQEIARVAGDDVSLKDVEPGEDERHQIQVACSIGAIVQYLDEQHEQNEREKRRAAFEQLLRVVSYGSTSALELNDELERIGLARVVRDGMNREQAREAIVAEASAKGVM